MMLRAILIISFCLLLSSCATIKEIQESQIVKTVGTFQLNPVEPNSYWYDGRSYEYNQYRIEIMSEPCEAHVRWNGKYIGDTPFVYSFTGTIDRNERVVLIGHPFDEGLRPQEAVLKVRTELPRKIKFDFGKKEN